MAAVIETERLRLRGWREGDKPDFARLINTPAVMAHLGGVRTQAEADAWIDRQIASQARHGLSFWALEHAGTGELVGLCGLRHGGHPGTPVADELEIGWRLAEPFWGRGFAREAARASLLWGFRNTARPRIAAWTVPANRPSWGLMERLGMTRRPDLDFDHPGFPPGHPLRRHIVYAAERPIPTG